MANPEYKTYFVVQKGGLREEVSGLLDVSTANKSMVVLREENVTPDGSVKLEHKGNTEEGTKVYVVKPGKIN